MVYEDYEVLRQQTVVRTVRRVPRLELPLGSLMKENIIRIVRVAATNKERELVECCLVGD